MDTQRTKKVKSAPKRELSSRQRLALLLYVKGGEVDMAKSCVAAGYPVGSASQRGSELLKNPLAVQYIDQITEKALQKCSKSAIDVLEELVLIPFSDVGEFFDEVENKGIELKSLKALGKNTRLIKEIKHYKKDFYRDAELIATEHRYEYKLHDKIAALRMLGDNQQLYGSNRKQEDNSNDQDNSAQLPRIFLPDNGKGGKAVIAVQYEANK